MLLPNWQHAQTPIWTKLGMQQCASGLCLQAYFYLDQCTVSPMCGKRPPKYHNFHQTFALWGLLCPFPFTNPGQIRPETVDPWPTLTRQISLELVYCVTFHGRKIVILGKLWHLRHSCTQTPLLIRAKSGVLTRQISSHRFILLPCGDEKLQILPFLDFRTSRWVQHLWLQTCCLLSCSIVEFLQLCWELYTDFHINMKGIVWRLLWNCRSVMQRLFGAVLHTTVLRLCGICPGKPGWAGTRRNIHPLLSS